MRRRAPRSVSLALADLTAELAPATTLARVQAAWRDVAGPAVGVEAQPVSERGGTVTIACRSSVWAQELGLMSPDLLEGLNAALSDGAGVTALRFVVGGPRDTGGPV